jgi:hypothetical protein
MGSSTYDHKDWTAYANTAKTKSTSQIFTSKGIDPSLDPKNITVRESCDSVVNPASTPVATFLDVTGSMGHMATVIAKTGLGTIMREIVDRKPVTDPHFLFGAFGDLLCDRAPLQMTQFEGGVNEMTPQLEKIFLEGGGGGNQGESPDLAWLFCATRTRIDSFLKRQKKGFLFTISDEPPPHGIRKDLLKQKCGMDIERDLTPEEVLAMASRTWECFHIFLEQGSYVGSIPAWKALMPERVLVIPDFTTIAEVIVSTLQVHAGVDKDVVARSWSGDTALIVANAMKGIVPGAGKDSGSGVVRF